MQHVLIPACYFPSTVLFVDDGSDFLLNFVLQLEEEIAYRTFDSSRKALDYIHNKRSESDNFQDILKHQYSLTNDPNNSRLSAIYSEVYNSYRFSEISVLFVDYALSGFDGIEFCRHVKNSTIKKVLLINQSNEPFAIAALKEGIIDKYIMKHEASAAQEITAAIYELQRAYFQTMSNLVIRLLSLTPPNCMYDKNFAQFFMAFKREKGIVEHYLFDNFGSFLLLDEDANPSFLVVKSDSEIPFYHNLALKEGANEELLNQLATGQKIPGLWDSQRPQNWSQWLVPAKQFHSDQVYYYAYLEGNTLFAKNSHHILSYHHYLEELDTEALLIG